MRMKLSEVLDRFAGVAVPAEEIARLEAEAERLEREARKAWAAARDAKRVNAARKRLAAEVKSPHRGLMIVKDDRIGWLVGSGVRQRTAITINADGWAREALGEYHSRGDDTVKQVQPGQWTDRNDAIYTEIDIEEDV